MGDDAVIKGVAGLTDAGGFVRICGCRDITGLQQAQPGDTRIILTDTGIIEENRQRHLAVFHRIAHGTLPTVRPGHNHSISDMDLRLHQVTHRVIELQFGLFSHQASLSALAYGKQALPDTLQWGGPELLTEPVCSPSC